MFHKQTRLIRRIYELKSMIKTFQSDKRVLHSKAPKILLIPVESLSKNIADPCYDILIPLQDHDLYLSIDTKLYKLLGVALSLANNKRKSR